MHLRTLGGLRLRGTRFARPKPLLLLAFLALEGPRPRRYLAEVFWPQASEPLRSLAVALARLRKGAPGAVAADAHSAWSEVPCDADRFERAVANGDAEEALRLYAGPFVHGVPVANVGSELEEWLWARRERLANAAQRLQLHAALAAATHRDWAAVGERAAAAWAVLHAAPDPDALRTVHDLLVAAERPEAGAARREAEGLGLGLARDRDEARTRLSERSVRQAGPVAAAASAVDGTRTAVRPLPRLATTFVGREPERAALTEVLTRPGPQLVTVVGPPGVGKSRLALQIAHDWQSRDAEPGAAIFVELARVPHGDALAPQLAATLGVPNPGDPDRTVARITERLQDRRTLIVLDELEGLLPGGAATIARLVEAAPDAAWLATSRTRSGLSLERVVPLHGLALPADELHAGPEALAADAPALFLRRARRVQPGFDPSAAETAALLRICRSVEGLPLALELAAAWVRVLPLPELAEAIERDLDLLATDAADVPERHRSVRAAFEHAWRRLDAADRTRMRRLSVASGGVRLDQAHRFADAGPRAAARLIDASLLRSDDRGRYAMHPLVHTFVASQAEGRPDERKRARAAHADAYLALLIEVEDDLTGGPALEQAIDRLAEDLDNVRTAVRYAAEQADLEALAAACRPLQLFFIQRGGRFAEAIRTFADAEEALLNAATAGSAEPRFEATLGRLEAARAWFHYRAFETDAAQRWAERALARLRPAADADRDDPVLGRALASVRNTLANVALRRGDLAAAARRFEEVHADALKRGLDRQVAIVANNLGTVRKAAGDLDGAERAYREALALNREAGNRRSEVRNRINLGSHLVIAGRPEEALLVLEEGLRLARATRFDALLPTVLSTAGAAALAAGQLQVAASKLGEAVAAMGPAPDPHVEAEVRVGRADLALARGRPSAAREEALRALALIPPGDDPETAAQAALTLVRALRPQAPARAAVLLGATEALPLRSRWLRERLADARSELARVLSPETLSARAGEGARLGLSGIDLNAATVKR